MTEHEKATVFALMRFHETAQKLLSGDRGVPEGDVLALRTHVHKYGLGGILKTPEMAYPKFDEMYNPGDMLNGVLSLGLEDSNANVETVGEQCLDGGASVGLCSEDLMNLDEFSFRDNLLQELKDIKASEDLDRLIEKCLLLESVYRKCQRERIPRILSHFIGDLFFATGKYDEAAERYIQLYENEDKNGRAHGRNIDLLNACYKAKRQPPVKVLLHERGLSLLKDDLEKYVTRRLSMECLKRGDNVFKWTMRPEKDCFSGGVFDCLSSSQAEDIRQRFGLEPWLNFCTTSAFDDFSVAVYSEVKVISRTQAEFKPDNFIIDKWHEKLDWFEAAITNLPTEEIVFGFHAPWTWKFSLDLFFPTRQLAWVFHQPSEDDAAVFKHGLAGKLQRMKEWSRFLAKARNSHAIRVVYVPVGHDKSNIRELLSLCESGDFNI